MLTPPNTILSYLCNYKSRRKADNAKAGFFSKIPFDRPQGITFHSKKFSDLSYPAFNLWTQPSKRKGWLGTSGSRL
jgi:hypothetical protein